MILSGNEIQKKLNENQIFVSNTWSEDSIKEASYALRIAGDGLVLDGEQYSPGSFYTGRYIEVKPGRIAILSTIERLIMPDNLVGKLGIRLKYALQGLTGLMGIQVDPYYGQEIDDERLFIRVVNLGNESINLLPGDPVFTFEIHTLDGDFKPPAAPRISMWLYLQRELANQREASWTYMTRVQSEQETEVQRVRNSLEPVVMFGVFLVAITILGVAIALLLGLRDIPNTKAPTWVTHWGWIVLIVTLSMGTLATALVGAATAWRILRPLRIRFSD